MDAREWPDKYARYLACMAHVDKTFSSGSSSSSCDEAHRDCSHYLLPTYERMLSVRYEQCGDQHQQQQQRAASTK